MKKEIGMYFDKETEQWKPIYIEQSIARPLFWLTMSIMGIVIILGWSEHLNKKEQNGKDKQLQEVLRDTKNCR